jgi:ferredoxin
MIIFGALLLLAGVFVNRPYCRYLCPYGVLLNLFSRFSSRHLTITPAECINCRLCEDVCPYDAILPSNDSGGKEEPAKPRKRFYVYLLLVPVFATAGGIVLNNLAPALATMHNDVRLAREIRLEKQTGVEAVSKAAVAFKEAGKTEEELFANELTIVSRFKKASPWAVFSDFTWFSMVSYNHKRRTGYVPHQGKCYSCGRCFKFCPVQPEKTV